MVATPFRPSSGDEGYPPSSIADLDPGPDLIGSLEDADRTACDEHRVRPWSRRPTRSLDNEERLDDAESLR